jgi:cobaltochelatase CobS
MNTPNPVKPKPMVKAIYGAAKLFGLSSNPAITGYEPGHEFQSDVPAVNSDYYFREELFMAIASFWDAGFHKSSGMYLFGFHGTGKTSLIEQFAARLNIPCFVLECSEDVELSDVLGQWRLINGNTVWVDGPLLSAFKCGGWFVCEEIDQLRPTITVAMHAVLDGGDLVVPGLGGKRYRRKSNFAFFATGNTNGTSSQHSLNYSGANEGNAATLDRFIMEEVLYMDAAQEVPLCIRCNPKVPEKIVEGCVTMANDVRKSFMSGSSPVTFSTRTLLRWIKLYAFEHAYHSSHLMPNASADEILSSALCRSIDRTLGFRIPDREERQFLYDNLGRIFGFDASSAMGVAGDE